MHLVKHFSLVTLILSIALLAPVAREVSADAPFLYCSVINLIATPEKYHGKKVRVMGYVVLEFERDVLYLSELDSQHGIGKNSIWLSLDEKMTKLAREHYEELNRHYILVGGTFDMTDTGHLGLHSGTIKEIERLGPWGKR